VNLIEYADRVTWNGAGGTKQPSSEYSWRFETTLHGATWRWDLSVELSSLKCATELNLTFYLNSTDVRLARVYH